MDGLNKDGPAKRQHEAVERMRRPESYPGWLEKELRKRLEAAEAALAPYANPDHWGMQKYPYANTKYRAQKSMCSIGPTSAAAYFSQYPKDIR